MHVYLYLVYVLHTFRLSVHCTVLYYYACMYVHVTAIIVTGLWLGPYNIIAITTLQTRLTYHRWKNRINFILGGLSINIIHYGPKYWERGTVQPQSPMGSGAYASCVHM